ncbi:polysaccharide biosynthesis tyrosine autokinase [uncultured Modestobacter sp.]|uniref:polysaccharide biosynthesis tyrosine autokinase n=1 Tax=uncultured Modestobacter sp. TaxID=380048 RepID=UPI0026364BC2|nr:polysaccharide biosynthesis tyrosine autokinase [uncultured Modestobacter sp.]
MELRRFLTLLRHHLVGIVISLVVCGVAAFALSSSTTPTYRSTAALFVSLQNGDSASDLAQGANYTRDQMASYATLATTPAVLQPVVDELALPGTARDLAHRVTAVAPNDTVVLEVSVADPSPEAAARIADAIAEQLIVVLGDVAPRGESGDATVRVSEVTPAEVPRFQTSPNTKTDLAVGLLLGLVVGVLYAVLRETLDTRVRDVSRVEAVTDAPVLGAVPRLPGESGHLLALADDPRGGLAEVFRQLSTNVEFLRVGDAPVSLLVTSSLPGEGKSTVAANLALALAEVGHRVVLVDADLRRPSVAQRLGLEGEAGLSTVLLGRVEYEDVRQEWGGSGLHVLTAGAIPPNPVQLLSSSRMADLMSTLESRYDVVVVDSAPVLPVTDALVLSRHATGTLLVVNSRALRRAQLTETLRRLDHPGTRLLGVVVNQLSDCSAVHGYDAYRAADQAPAPGRRSTWWRVPGWVRSPRRSADGTPVAPASETSGPAPTGRTTTGAMSPADRGAPVR